MKYRVVVEFEGDVEDPGTFIAANIAMSPMNDNDKIKSIHVEDITYASKAWPKKYEFLLWANNRRYTQSPEFERRGRMRFVEFISNRDSKRLSINVDHILCVEEIKFQSELHRPSCFVITKREAHQVLCTYEEAVERIKSADDILAELDPAQDDSNKENITQPKANPKTRTMWDSDRLKNMGYTKGAE